MAPRELLVSRFTGYNWFELASLTDKVHDSYPEGHFRGNQLLKLRLVFRPYTKVNEIDLHVKTSADLQPSFPGLHPLLA